MIATTSPSSAAPGAMVPLNLPDYLPARMVNEFVYCPRLFYYEQVEQLFAQNRYTVEGAIRHAKLDAAEHSLPSAAELAESGETLHARSITLASETQRLIATLDVLEAEGATATPVDYKRGRPRVGAEGLPEAWDADRAQLAVQAIVLRDNGYDCREGVVYYSATRQRVRVAFDESLIAETLDAVRRAREVAAAGRIPPPLVDSPKCPGCSLVSICLPNETRLCRDRAAPTPTMRQRTLFEIDVAPSASANAAEGAETVRRIVPARDDLRPLYLNTQGLSIGKSGAVLKVKLKDQLLEEVRINELCQVNLFGNIQLTTQAIQTLCEEEVPIAYFSLGGWFYGVTQGLGERNVVLRREQFRWSDSRDFCLRFARALVTGKIRNQRTLLLRNHIEVPAVTLALMKELQWRAERAESLDELLGIEGNGARAYFEQFGGLIKRESATSGETAAGESAVGLGTFHFEHRNRRPPRDPVNALLSLAYSVLAKDLMIVCHAVGFDPFLGFYHQPRYGRAALALDLMEPFRPLIADSAVLSAINTGMVTERDFLRMGDAVSLTADGRKAFFRAYEQRMDALVTHPLFGYRVSYRRMLEIQTRLLARVVTGELTNYPVFTTR